MVRDVARRGLRRAAVSELKNRVAAVMEEAKRTRSTLERQQERSAKAEQTARDAAAALCQRGKELVACRKKLAEAAAVNESFKTRAEQQEAQLKQSEGHKIVRWWAAWSG